MKKELRPLTLGMKISLSILITIVFCLLFSVFIVSQVVKNQSGEKYDVDKMAATESISYSLSPLLYLYDYKQVERIITSSLNYKNIAYISVFNNDGILIVTAAGKNESSLKLEIVKNRLMSKENVIGSIEIGFSREYIDGQIQRTTIALISGLSGFLIVVGFALFAFINCSVIKPIGVFTRIVTAMDYENLSSRVNIYSKDELGVLAASFNRMTDNLENKVAKLEAEITAHKRSIRALGESELQFRRGVMDSPFPIMIHAEDGEVVRINNVWTELTGYTHSDIPTMADWIQKAYGERAGDVRSLIDSLFERKTVVHDAVWAIRTKSGETRTWDFSSGPLGRLPDNRLLVISIAHDFTEREMFRAQVIQSQKLDAIGTLAGGVAHEINNPINGIMGYAQLIKDNLEPESPEQEFASEIIKETKRVATIVKNLLTFARQDKENHSPARMTDIVGGVTSLIGTIIKRDQITLNMEELEDLPIVHCRSQQIQQIIINLLTNARDALNQRYEGYDENKTINLRAHTFEKEGCLWIRVIVEDHGTGRIYPI